MDSRSLIIVLLALAAASGAAFLIFPYLSGDARGEKRQDQLLNRGRSATRSTRWRWYSVAILG